VGHVPRRRGQEERALLPPLGARRRGDEVSAPRRFAINWLPWWFRPWKLAVRLSLFFCLFLEIRFHLRHFRVLFCFISLAGWWGRVFCGCDFTQTGLTSMNILSFWHPSSPVRVFRSFFGHFIVNIMGIFVHGR